MGPIVELSHGFQTLLEYTLPPFLYTLLIINIMGIKIYMLCEYVKRIVKPGGPKVLQRSPIHGERSVQPGSLESGSFGTVRMNGK